ncbi:MAG TPA: type II toxin-antitoxin system HipA family toxin [Sphaerochaeta sp.]|nr:type II toxin-antitoxin system HipA family toxin [Sphaerochaeta sp.]
MNTIAEVRLWNTRIGAVELVPGQNLGVFQFDKDFLASNIEVSPLRMPLSAMPYSFPELSKGTFHGLPGLLADSLPDAFGNAVIQAWLAQQGVQESEFNAIDRLCYTGTRGMGALEYYPLMEADQSSSLLHVGRLVELASLVLEKRKSVSVFLNPNDSDLDSKAFKQILQVGSSAGGARAKAVIAYNPKTHETRSGQVPAPAGFEYWLLKFDGITGNGDKDVSDSKGFTLIEYAYSLLAKECNITMADCRLFSENGRNHFMTKRFDRLDDGQKVHMQSLGALAHFDYNQSDAYSYEQAFQVMDRLNLGQKSREQLFRRMVFNIVVRNQDDHVKNISFLMDRTGTWSLAPAYDLTYSYRASSKWVSRHQMSMQGKRDHFTLEDFKECGKRVHLVRGRAQAIVEELSDAVQAWKQIAHEVGVEKETMEYIYKQFRLF